MNLEELARQFIDALHTLEQGSDGDADQLAMLYAEDATLSNAALELTDKTATGRDAILQFWVEYKSTLGQCFSTFHHVTTSDKAAGLFWTTEGTGPDGQPVRYHGATLLEFEHSGLISFFRGYYDTRELAVKAPGEGS